MTKVYENYSDQEYQLYEIVGWAMLGLIDTENVDRPNSFAGFLYDLFKDVRGGDLAGEPGWSLERIDLNEGFRLAHPYISQQALDALDELRERGNPVAFWMDIQDQGDNVIDVETFWKVIKDSFGEFVMNNPGMKKELDLISFEFPQLRNV